MTRVRKAVLPVAGLGTRVLPATKTVAKEMLPVFDRPALQYVVDEGIAAGIEHFVFVTGRNKNAIEDYFDKAFELEAMLTSAGKTALLDELAAILPQPGACSFVRQQAPLGLGHAVWCARELVGDEPFAVMLPDMIMVADTPCLKSMTDAHAQTGGNIVAVEAVPREDVSKYGIVDLGEAASTGLSRLKGMVEKPAIDAAPSNFMISGRYILEPEIFDRLSDQDPGAGGEIQLTDAMLRLMSDSDFFAYEFGGKTYDTGSKLGYLEAFMMMSLDHDREGEAARAMIKKIASTL